MSPAAAELAMLITARDTANQAVRRLHKSLDDLQRQTGITGGGLTTLGDKSTTAGNKLAQTQQHAVSLQQSMSAVGDIGRTMTFGFTLPMIAAGAAVTKIAMDAVEAKNLFTVALGDMAESGNSFAKDMHDAYKLNETSVKGNLGVLYNMATSMGINKRAAYDMSEQLVKLAYDSASFRNVGLDEAFDKIKSGISGETEPLKRWGISVHDAAIEMWALKNGITTTVGEMSQQQKMMARYALITDQMKNDVGDLNRTWDTGANQVRIFQEQLKTMSESAGNVFLPAVNAALLDINTKGFPAVEAGLEVLKASWAGMSAESQSQILNIAVALGAAGPLMLSIQAVHNAVIALSFAFKTLGVLAIAGLGLALMDVTAKFEANNAAMQAQGDTLMVIGDQVVRVGGEYQDLGKMGHEALGDLAGDLLEGSELQKKYQEWVDLSTQKQEEAAKATEEARKRVASQNDATALAKANWDKMGMAAAGGSKKTVDAAKNIEKAVNDAKRGMQELANTPLSGERAASDKAFQIEKGIKEMQVALAQMDQIGDEAWNREPSHPKDWSTSHWDLENAIAGQRQLMQRVNDEAWLQFEPAKRELKNMLPYQEFTAEQLKFGIEQYAKRQKQVESEYYASNPQMMPGAGLTQATANNGASVATSQGADISKDMIKGITDGFNEFNFKDQMQGMLTDQLSKVSINMGPWRLTSQGFELDLKIVAPSASSGSSSGGSSGSSSGSSSDKESVVATARSRGM